MSGFKGKHVVVTGGGSGIGLSVSRHFIDKGASVTITGRNEPRLQAAAESIGSSYQPVDVTIRLSVRESFDAAVGVNGPIDILVNNAGAAEAVPFARMTDDDWDKTIAVNLTGVYNCSKAVIDSMLECGTGRIVNVGSTAGLVGYAYVSAYCAAKHGVIGLTRALALEYARKGITINAVCPGYTDTDIVQRSLDRIVKSTGRSREEALAELVKSNPQGRLIQPDEVAETVLWICTQNSMNGQAVAIAGGEIM